MIRRLPLVVLLTVVVACGASARDRALRGTLTTLNAARDALIAYDEQAQADIVASAVSLEAGKAELAAWREKRTPVVAAINVAYQALAAASVFGLEPAKAIDAASKALAAWQTLRGGK